MITQQEKAIALCEHFKPAYLEYEQALGEGYDPEINYWYGFGCEANDGKHRVFDFCFTTDDRNGDICCTLMQCVESDDGLQTDWSSEVKIL